VSEYCNLRCTFCPQSMNAWHHVDHSMMSRNTFQQVVDDASGFPTTIKLLRVAGLGEPLTNPHLAEMLDYARQSKAFDAIELITNGVLLDRVDTTSIAESIDRVVVSVEGVTDGSYSLHERTSETKVTIDGLRRGIEKLYANRGGCKVHVKAVDAAIRTDTDRQMFIDLFSDRCDTMNVEPVVPMWPNMDTNPSPSISPVCAAVFKSLQIYGNGDVVACCVDWMRHLILGKIGINTLRDIWESQELKVLRLQHLLGLTSWLIPCRECHQQRCGDMDDLQPYRKELLHRLQPERI
jgi:wyosine [tRNA(Phe)-imidazoG37] synthetase (radical SAM superfamily)